MRDVPPGPSGDVHRAVKDEDVAALAAAIAKGGNVNEEDSDGFSPLTKAVSDCNPSIVKALLKAGADVRRKDTGTKWQMITEYAFPFGKRAAPCVALVKAAMQAPPAVTSSTPPVPPVTRTEGQRRADYVLLQSGVRVEGKILDQKFGKYVIIQTVQGEQRIINWDIDQGSLRCAVISRPF